MAVTGLPGASCLVCHCMSGTQGLGWLGSHSRPGLCLLHMPEARGWALPCSQEARAINSIIQCFKTSVLFRFFWFFFYFDLES
jgi:hypothetical protein